MGKRRKNADDAGTACAPPTLVTLLQDENICRMLMGSALSEPEDAKQAAGLRASCRALRDLVDGAAEAIFVQSEHAAELLLRGDLLPRLTRLKTVRYEYFNNHVPLFKFLAKLPRSLSALSLRQLTAPLPLATSLLFFSSLTKLQWKNPYLEAEDYQYLGQLQQLELLNLRTGSSVNAAPLAALTQLTRFTFSHEDGDFLYMDPRNMDVDAVPQPVWQDVLPALTKLEEARLDCAQLDTLLHLGALPRLRALTLTTHPDPDVAERTSVEPLAGAFAALEDLTFLVHHLAEDLLSPLPAIFSKMAALKRIHFACYKAGYYLPELLQLPRSLEGLRITLTANDENFSGELLG